MTVSASGGPISDERVTEMKPADRLWWCVGLIGDGSIGADDCLEVRTVMRRALREIEAELSRLRAVLTQQEAAARYWRSLLVDTAIGLRGQSISPVQVVGAIERALAAARDLEALTEVRSDG